jgi:hypothetical protein
MTKRHATIGACGIDCALCPRYHTDGPSRCPGCDGSRFDQLHPTCKILTCATKSHAFETCAECEKRPCAKILPWDQADSFVTHQACFHNLDAIQRNGLEAFLTQQNTRLKVLQFLLDHYNDGRKKSLYCLAAALLPEEDLLAILTLDHDAAIITAPDAMAKKLEAMASMRGITLRLRK